MTVPLRWGRLAGRRVNQPGPIPPKRVRTPAAKLRRAALPRQALAWTLLAAAGVVSVAAWARSGRDPAVNYPPETDRPAAAALWAATAWRDSVGLGRTPVPVEWQPTPGYVRVILDRGDADGCVQVGVTVTVTAGAVRFALAGDAAPVACPPNLAAATVEGPEVANQEPLARWTVQLAQDWLSGRSVDLYAAPGVRLTPPPGYRHVTVGRVTARTVDRHPVLGRHLDVVAHGTADGIPVAVRFTVTDRAGKYELVAVRGGLSSEPDGTVGTLPTPTITTAVATTSTSTTAATTTTGPPPVTVSPTASTVNTAPPPPAAAGQ